MNVLAAMERHPADPWKVRDRMLNEMGWCSEGVALADWTPNKPHRRVQGRQWGRGRRNI